MMKRRQEVIESVGRSVASSDSRRYEKWKRGICQWGDGENVINRKQLRVPREQLLLSRTEHKKHIPERRELPVNPQYFIAFSSLKMSFGPKADEANMSHQRYGPKTNH